MRLTLLVLSQGAYPGTQCDVRRLQISSQLLAQVVVLPSADAMVLMTAAGSMPRAAAASARVRTGS
jgi:hypothetical protein